MPVTDIPKDVQILQDLVQNQANEIKLLHEQVRLLIAQRYGSSSEKLSKDQLHLFGDLLKSDAESLKEEEIEVPAHSRKKKGRKPLPDHLERIVKEHDLPEEERQCSCGCGPMEKIGEEISEQLDIIPAKVIVIRHVRHKYACKHCCIGVTTTPLPPQPIPKSNASAGCLAYVAVSKYEDALPLYRQEKILNRYGFKITRGTLSHWMIQCGKLVQPLLNFYRDQIFENNLVQMDETPLQVLKEPDKSSQSKSYMWVQRGGPPGRRVILYDYAPTRRQTVPLNLLQGYQGYLQVDGYSGYNAIGQENGVILVGCWAHARRKFMDALKSQKKNTKTGHAYEGVRFIKALYRIDKEAKEKTMEIDRQRHRCIESQPILDEIREWLDQALVRVPPKTNTGKALHYLNGQWNKLTRFLEKGDLPLDNNAVENAIRPFALGRKNWMFSDTPKGAHASANLYSLIETAKANDWEPYEYLKIVLAEIPSAKTANDIEILMPWNLKKSPK